MEPEKYELQCKVQVGFVYKREDERKHNSSFQIMKKKCGIIFMSMMSKSRSNRLRWQFRKFRRNTRKTFSDNENSEVLEYVAYDGFGITICCNKRLAKYLQELHQLS